MGSIDSEIKSPILNDRHRFITNLVFTANWVQSVFAERIKPYGISSQQYNILRILNGAGDWLAMTEVKDGLLDKAPNATRLVNKLLQKELIERHRSEADRRVVYVRITEAGKTLFAEINQEDNPIQNALNAHVTVEEARMVSEILDRFRG